jgi:hypothetical protein
MTKKIQKHIVKNIVKKVKKRLNKEIFQSGGFGPRENNFNDNGNFGNLITQITYLVVNGIASIVDGGNAAYSVFTLPADFMDISGKPNEPLPSNTPISRAINII